MGDCVGCVCVGGVRLLCSSNLPPCPSPTLGARHHPYRRRNAAVEQPSPCPPHLVVSRGGGRQGCRLRFALTGDAPPLTTPPPSPQRGFRKCPEKTKRAVRHLHRLRGRTLRGLAPAPLRRSRPAYRAGLLAVYVALSLQPASRYNRTTPGVLTGCLPSTGRPIAILLCVLALCEHA